MHMRERKIQLLHNLKWLIERKSYPSIENERKKIKKKTTKDKKINKNKFK